MAQTGREALIEKITGIATASPSPKGLEVVEIELLGGGKQRVLRIYIDRPEGVTHGDCEIVSQQGRRASWMRRILFPVRTTRWRSVLPGVERKLTKPARFPAIRRTEGKDRHARAVEDQKYWEGVLRGVEGEQVLIEPSEGRVIHIPLSSIKRANLKFEW